MIIQANALHLPLASECVQCCVTSPPYWGLRDYGTARWEGGDPGCAHIENYNLKRDASGGVGGGRIHGTRGQQPSSSSSAIGFREICGDCGARRIDAQLGLEKTPEAYVSNMVQVFREVWRVLKPDGTLWCNLGDSYNGVGRGEKANGLQIAARVATQRTVQGLKSKDLVGIPWRVAFALQADGWYLRSDIIWHKPNPMPESVTDRPTKSHEYLFLLAKQERYYYNAEAIAERVADSSIERLLQPTLGNQNGSARVPGKTNGNMKAVGNIETRNARSVWTIATQPYSGAHFATFPEKLVEPCILAGSRSGDVVLDPFCGSGTVMRVATKFQRKGVGCDINPSYLRDQADKRMRNVQVQFTWTGV